MDSCYSLIFLVNTNYKNVKIPGFTYSVYIREKQLIENYHFYDLLALSAHR